MFKFCHISKGVSAGQRQFSDKKQFVAGRKHGSYASNVMDPHQLLFGLREGVSHFVQDSNTPTPTNTVLFCTEIRMMNC